MGKRIVVQNDKVDGTDTHSVTGTFSAGSPPPAYSGTGDYQYTGKMTSQLSDFVKIDGKAVALVSSRSKLDSDHIAANGTNFVPSGPNTGSLSFAPPAPDGVGIPSSVAGSEFVKVNGVAILLDQDKLNTCGSSAGSGNSTVTAQNQDFVSCSG